MKINLSKIDKLQIIIMTLMFVGVIGNVFFNDVSLVFRLKFIEEGYWFVRHLELVGFCFLFIGISLGYTVAKMKYRKTK